MKCRVEGVGQQNTFIFIFLQFIVYIMLYIILYCHQILEKKFLFDCILSLATTTEQCVKNNKMLLT